MLLLLFNSFTAPSILTITTSLDINVTSGGDTLELIITREE